MEKFHRSVMVTETLQYLNVAPEGRFLDATFGEGGHSEAMLKAGAKEIVSLDRDTQALDIYRREGALKDDPRLKLVHARFSTAGDVLKGEVFDGVLMDLGVSTRQLLVAERGFSFAKGGPLDMRMDPSDTSMLTLEEFLHRVDPETLSQGLARNVDMKNTLAMARELLETFRAGHISNTAELAKLTGERWGKKHPATVLFLALRMMVNEELDEIETGVPAALSLLKPGGRLAVITFHSTEDRVVKKIFKRLAGKCACEPNDFICSCPKIKHVELTLKKPLEPSRQETRVNPRARSAKLRVVEKVALDD